MRLLTTAIAVVGCCVFLLVADAQSAKKKRDGHEQPTTRDIQKAAHKEKAGVKHTAQGRTGGAKAGAQGGGGHKGGHAKPTGGKKSGTQPKQGANGTASAAERDLGPRHADGTKGGKHRKHQVAKTENKGQDVDLTPAHADHRGKKASVADREKHEALRIERGEKKGALTPGEAADLRKQEADIAAAEHNFRSDGKLSKNERKKLQEMLDGASTAIWAEKHDADGKQLNVQAFGKNVYAKDSLLAKVNDPNLSGADARTITKDYRAMLTAKRRMHDESLSSAERARAKDHFNELLERYFERRR